MSSRGVLVVGGRYVIYVGGVPMEGDAGEEFTMGVVSGWVMTQAFPCRPSQRYDVAGLSVRWRTYVHMRTYTEQPVRAAMDVRESVKE